MPNMRRSSLSLLVLVSIGASLLASGPTQAKGVATCTKLGVTKKMGATQFRCVKTEGQFTWAVVVQRPVVSKIKANLTILGAASLTAVLPELAGTFRKANPRVKFTFSFAGSATLAQQIIAGAPVDLFFSAGPAPMKTVRMAGDIDGRTSNFTSNSLVLAVPRNNPARIFGLADLGKPGVRFLLCAPQVPCGSAAAKVLDLAKITAQPVSLENDVKMVLNKVAMGEADAGLVYRTDITSNVKSIEFPEAQAAINEYPAAVISGSRSPSTAHAFIKFVLSQAGQTILHKAGFGKR